MSDIVIARPDTTAVERSSHAVVAQAQAMVIASKEQHAAGQEFLQVVATGQRRVKELFFDSKAAINAAKAATLAAEKKLAGPLAEARVIVNDKLTDYEQDQARIAAEARRKAEAAARQQEEEEQLAAAEVAESQGHHELADAIIDEPLVTPIIHVETETAKVDGVSARVTWSAEVTDKCSLVRFCAENPDFQHLLEPNTTALNSMARSAREGLNIPGVRAVSKTGRAVRAL